MKFIVSSSLLLKNLQLISGVINSSNTLPILDNFLFDLKDNSLKVTASDLETTMTVTIPLTMSENEGSLAIPARILLETLKTFADIPVSFLIDTSNLSVELSAGDGNYKLTGQDAVDFPRMQSLEDTLQININSSILKTAFQKTIFATGSDDLRPVMAGVFSEITPEGLTFVATDAHRLVRYRYFASRSDSAASMILPKKPLNQLKNILPDDQDVEMKFNNTNAHFSYGNVELQCRLIEGKYPNYEAVIPKENPNIMIVDRQMLVSSIRRISLYASQSTHQIRLRITGKELTISAEDIDYMNAADERLVCNFEGEDMEIGFNSKFVLEMLTNLSSEQVRMELSAPNRAGLLIPVDDENKDESILMLVMPVMLNQ